MPLLIVSAAASPLFGDFLIEVSVTDADGGPVFRLKPANFLVAHLASFNHAGANPRPVKSATEGPDGFYILQLKTKNKVQSQLPAGHYVFRGCRQRSQIERRACQTGQTVRRRRHVVLSVVMRH